MKSEKWRSIANKSFSRRVQSLNISLGPKCENRDIRDFNFLTLFFPTNKMPPQRTPLGSISGNRMRGEETKPYTRGKIVEMHMAGAKPRAIREAFGVTKNAIKTAFKNNELKLKDALKPKSG